MAWTPMLAAAPRAARHIRGTTLIELAVAMSVTLLLCMLAMPSFQGLRKRQQITATQNLLASHLASARAAAITQNVPVIVCPSTGDRRCRGDGDWSLHWLAFRDPDGNHQPDDETDIYRNDPAPQHPAIRIFSTAGRRYMRYQPTGMSPGSNLTIRICYQHEVAGSIVVNNAGRARSARPAAPTPC